MGEAEFWIEEGLTLPQLPHLAPLSLDVGPTRDPEEHELHVARTFGCGDWRLSGEEELRFSTDDLRLVSAWLSIPATSQTDEAKHVPARWADRSAVKGQLVAKAADPFRLPQTVSRHCSIEDDMLVCQVAEGSAEGELLGVEVADGLELLFTDGLYAGWLLRAPETALGREPSRTGGGTPRDPELMGWLAQFYVLTDDEVIARIELDEDREALAAMRGLRDRIRVGDGGNDGRGTGLHGGREVLRSYLTTWVESLEELID
ncbi:hypothetical protein [Streptomyces sp. NPDC002133]|uniref:hypothetical protein n=1 Tax=Streptomyces sp. NPDC002133 TaxID=3154409 RepID=UPI00331CDBD9